jgi:hypothetical protein
VDALRIPLEDGTIPHWLQYLSSPLVANAFDKVLDELHILSIGRKDGGEFVLSRLKHAKGCVERAINNLYVFQTFFSDASRQCQRNFPRAATGSVPMISSPRTITTSSIMLTTTQT